MREELALVGIVEIASAFTCVALPRVFRGSSLVSELGDCADTTVSSVEDGDGGCLDIIEPLLPVFGEALE